MTPHDEFELQAPKQTKPTEAEIDLAKKAFPNALAILAEFRASFGQDVKLTYASENGQTLGNPNKGESGKFLTVDRYLALGKKKTQIEVNRGRK
jgi:hypothetical protein